MYPRAFLSSGGVEVSVGGVWLLLSLVGFLQGNVPLSALVADLATLGAVAVGVRRPRPALALFCLLVPIALLLDPVGRGFSTYIVACGVVLYARLGEFRAAAVVSGLLGASTLILSLRRMGAEPDWFTAAVVTLLIVLIAWLVGLGFRWVARIEAERVSSQYVERQMRMAVDIHDFVGRNLTGVLLAAAHASPEQRSDPQFLDELVARVRSADATLRQVTADLQREATTVPFAAVGAVDALRGGVAELESGGLRIELADGAADRICDLPPEVDLVVSRIVAEALHNVLKHADRSRPCQVEVERDERTVSIVVTNALRPRHQADRGRPRLGLVGMGRHSALAGGTVTSGREGDTWVCRVSIPVRRTEVPA